MRLTVLGGSGAWPVPGQGCSGYLVAHRRALLLLDPGPGTVGELLRLHRPADVTGVVVSHGHADHTADLVALVRSRQLTGTRHPLPVYAGPGVIDPVLALDPPHLVRPFVHVIPVEDGHTTHIADLRASWRALPHHVPNLGVRLQSPTAHLVYTGDAGLGEQARELAQDADLLLADATHPWTVPDDDAGLLGSAADAGRTASLAGVEHLVLAHLWPGTDPDDAIVAARRHYAGPIDVSRPGLTVQIPHGRADPSRRFPVVG